MSLDRLEEPDEPLSDTPRTDAIYDKYELHCTSEEVNDLHSHARTLERENNQLHAALKQCAKALDEVSTHLDAIDCALRKCVVHSTTEDDKSCWRHEITAHNSNAKGINNALALPAVQNALKGEQ